jgi:hypothetical protein
MPWVCRFLCVVLVGVIPCCQDGWGASVNAPVQRACCPVLPPCCPRVARPPYTPGRRHGLHAYTLERSGVSPATDYFLSSFLPKAKRHAGRDGLP